MSAVQATQLTCFQCPSRAIVIGQIGEVSRRAGGPNGAIIVLGRGTDGKNSGWAELSYTAGPRPRLRQGMGLA